MNKEKLNIMLGKYTISEPHEIEINKRDVVIRNNKTKLNILFDYIDCSFSLTYCNVTNKLHFYNLYCSVFVPAIENKKVL